MYPKSAHTCSYKFLNVSYACFSKGVSAATHETLSGHFERMVLFLNEIFGGCKTHDFGIL